MMKYNKFGKMVTKWLVSFGILILIVTAGIAINGVNMYTYTKYSNDAVPAAGDIEFTAFYGGDDNYIWTEDSYNKFTSNYGENPNEGWWGTPVGVARVNTDAFSVITDGTPYEIWISGISQNEAGKASGTVSGTTNPTTVPTGNSLSNRFALSSSNYLATPQNFTVNAGNGEVFIRWNAVAGATGYRVYRGPVPANNNLVFQRVGTPTANYLVDSTVTNGSTYWYTIVAADNDATPRRSGHPTEVSVIPTTAGVPTITAPNSGERDQTITITGSGFGATQGSGKVYINGVEASAYTSWSATQIVATIASSTPTGAGKLVVVTNSNLAASRDFTVLTDDTDPPTITSTIPNDGATGVPITQNISITFSEAMDTSSIAFTCSPSDPGGWSPAWTNGDQTVTYAHSDFNPNIDYTITVTAAKDLAGNDLTGDNDFGFSTGSGTDPYISSVLPIDAEVGQTVKISGTNFGTSMGSSAVRFGTTIANPTSWGATSITVAVPAGFTAGDVNVVVQVNSVDSNTATITITGEKIYIEDYEGGAVGSFTAPAPLSGYYVFEDVLDITPTSLEINAQLRQTEAAHDDVYGAKVKYSYVGTDGTDWGGGWGAKLANVLDLTNIDEVSLFINWDGSTNNVTLNLKDSDGTAYAATISNATLMALPGYGEVNIDKSSFALDPDACDKDDQGNRIDDGSFDWSEITGYNFVYDTNGTSANYHYIDTITANLTEIDTREGIRSIQPPAGPAGTQVTITGLGFGDVQGMSDLIFENIETGAWYAAEDIISWNNTTIVAIVPEPATRGNYKVKVIRVTIIQESGETQAWQSNDVDFRVTASAAGEGGMATIRPNPFNPLASGANAQEAKAAKIAFSNSEHRTVGIYIYDMTARLVYHNVTTSSEISWSGYDTHDNLVGDGAYILRVVDEQSKRLIAKGKILVIKKK